MKLNEAFPSDYIKVNDLSARPEMFKIVDVKLEDFQDPTTKEKSSKPVIQFHGTEKKFICNKTNWNRIAKQFGDDSDNWIGKEIGLVLEAVEAFGKMTDGIRVSIPTA